MTQAIIDKIKDLNARRASQQKQLNNIKTDYNNHTISESHYTKLAKKYEKKIEKIKDHIRELENKL